MISHVHTHAACSPSIRASANFPKDKGLCGGVNTAVAKQIRLGLATEEAKGNVSKANRRVTGEGKDMEGSRDVVCTQEMMLGK